LDLASFQAVTVEVARALVFFAEPSYIKSSFISILTGRDTDQLLCGWNSILAKGIISLSVKGQFFFYQSSSVASCHCRPFSCHE
jgi:hypothetical protein